MFIYINYILISRKGNTAPFNNNSKKKGQCNKNHYSESEYKKCSTKRERVKIFICEILQKDNG
jgi:hypothetical protein